MSLRDKRWEEERKERIAKWDRDNLPFIAIERDMNERLNRKEDTPFYLRAWFWLVVFVSIGIADVLLHRTH